jgi:hypothetical protein
MAEQRDATTSTAPGMTGMTVMTDRSVETARKRSGANLKFERVLTVVRADDGLLEARLLVHEDLLDVCLGVLKGATIVPGSVAPDAIEKFRLFQKWLQLQASPVFDACRAQGVPEAFSLCVAFIDVVAVAITRADHAAMVTKIDAIDARIKAWTAREAAVSPACGMQASLARALRVAARESHDDTQSESSESETCGPDSAVATEDEANSE